MTNLSTNPPPAAGRVAGIVRLVRQICLLHAQGDAGRAAQLQENDLAGAVRDLRLAHGPAALSDDGLRDLFATEERRVAEAQVLAELLIPQLVGNRAAAGSARRPLPPDPAAARIPPAGPPAISDLLDAMLAAERHGRRSPPATPRES